jgi:hypothetical protein
MLISDRKDTTSEENIITEEVEEQIEQEPEETYREAYVSKEVRYKEVMTQY